MIRRAATLAAFCAVGAARAEMPRLWFDAASDLRERGISMSGGRAGIEGGISIGSIGPTLDVAAMTTRGTSRHGGADLRASVLGGYSMRSGGTTLRGDVAWRKFVGGRGPLDYGEAGASVDRLIGPVTLAASLRYAPSQRALGGSLAYARIGADGGLPGSPWSLAAHVGRTSGGTRDPVRAARLRPSSTYVDWAIGVRRVAGPALLSLTYSDTDIARAAPGPARALRSGSGPTLVARLALNL